MAVKEKEIGTPSNTDERAKAQNSQLKRLKKILSKVLS